ncbi:MAG: 2-keto-3-deoxygluconate permease [Lachnoclostridium edouardi]|uniref:2-keto-3-deoxygluconate permease n=1 Tax=Lachnoclostridium edouardi TaxID=1926283 RepID=UPI0026DC41B2|nr:2-keto-3-deoxygluconate permease [Lachnoclostridium edouardi]MDO4277573.1 2-keto-3-deoxygluconate permease [Lachnoclostridium edouardi]
MKIVDTIRKFPAGMQVIPLLMACTINTFAPEALQIGGFTSGLFSNAGAATAVGMFMFCSGATIDMKQAGEPFAKGFVMLAAKYIIGTLLGILLGKAFGPAGILGITPVAVIGATTNSNGVMYGTLAKKFGVPNDVGAIAPLALNDGPFLTMIALGASGMADIPVKSLVAALVPLFLGMLFANLDEKIRDMCSNAAPFLIPFNGWTLGAGMTWDAVLKAGVPGIILGLVTLISTGIGTYFIFNWVFRRKKRPLATGVAIGNTAGNAIPTPKFVAEADPSLEGIVPAATAQIATSCVVTAILCPVLTTWVDKMITKKYGELDRSSFGDSPEW